MTLGNTPLDAARSWIERGFHPVPIPDRKKAPALANWPTLRLTAETAPAHFNGTPQNIGVLLGDDYGSTDVDCDCTEAIDLAKVFLPDTGMVFGRNSKPASHYLFRSDPPITSKTFKDPTNDKMLIELRCRKRDGTIGLQTVVPPSTHESGEAVCFQEGFDRHPANVDGPDLECAVSRIAAAALLARHWPAAGSGRHSCELALSGALARAGWIRAEAERFVTAVYRAVPSHDATKLHRVEQAVADTFDKEARGNETTGVPTLVSHVGREVTRAALEWLGINSRASGLEGYGWNDSGNGERLADAHLDDLVYCEDRKSFAVYDGNRWVFDNDIRAERFAEEVLRDCFAEAGKLQDTDERKKFVQFLNKSLHRAGIANMVHSAKRKVRLVRINEFDQAPTLLNFPNGTLNLGTGEFSAHRSHDLITKMIPFDYDGEAECPTFMRFLSRIMGCSPDASEGEIERADRLIGYLQRAFGCGATGKPEKLLFILYGNSGNNGKTTLLEIIRAALGDHEYSGEVQIDTLMARPKEAASSNAINADLADLKGCRLVSSSEVEQGQALSLARIKYITGLSQIRARYLKENYFNFQPTHKIFMDCNHRPTIKDSTDAVWNRVKSIPFTVQIPDDEIDTDLPRKLRMELPGIIRWVAEGARIHLNEGIQDIPEVARATQEYREESDKLAEFFEECCVFEDNACTPIKEPYLRYTTWASSNQEKYPLGKPAFEQQLERRRCAKRRRENGTVRVWTGIRLLEK